ncbi:hypothetical protein [Mycobacterium sp. NPDC050041]|uniref:hypothetical protein n=1 Tax=Mycobacterium sp. NPDC050041 TaxID=3364293 RepID=UPI003C302433
MNPDADRPRTTPAVVLTPAVVTIFTTIASQAALIAALLYYFGRVHTFAFYRYFGVDAGTLGLSTTEYVVRSLESAILPVVLVILAGLLLATSARHMAAGIDRVRDRPQWYRVATAVVALVIVVATAAILNGVSSWEWAELTRGYLLPSAVLVLAGALVVARRLFALGTSNGTGIERLWSLTVGALVLGGVLWLTALYAAEKGERAATDRVATLTSAGSTDLIIYSENLLGLEKDRIRVDPIPTIEGSRYRFQYSGLRLLFRTAHEYVVVPAEWQKGRDHVAVIPIDGTMRFDLVPH